MPTPSSPSCGTPRLRFYRVVEKPAGALPVFLSCRTHEHTSSALQPESNSTFVPSLRVFRARCENAAVNKGGLSERRDKQIDSVRGL